jgi:hypothetical protein
MRVLFLLNVKDHCRPGLMNFLGSGVGQGQAEQRRGCQKFLNQAFQSFKISAELPAQLWLGAMVQNNKKAVAGMIAALL